MRIDLLYLFASRLTERVESLRQVGLGRGQPLANETVGQKSTHPVSYDTTTDSHQQRTDITRGQRYLE